MCIYIYIYICTYPYFSSSPPCHKDLVLDSVNISDANISEAYFISDVNISVDLEKNVTTSADTSWPSLASSEAKG